MNRHWLGEGEEWLEKSLPEQGSITVLLKNREKTSEPKGKEKRIQDKVREFIKPGPTGCFRNLAFI